VDRCRFWLALLLPSGFFSQCFSGSFADVC